MQNVIEDLKEYLLDVWGLKVEPKPCELINNLPFFLKHLYLFYSVIIFDKSYFLAVARDPQESTPLQISRHMEQIEKITNMSCIYVAGDLPTYNRQRLVANRVRFVIPKTQMYLPDLGIDHRKISSKISITPQSLIPSAQTVVIYALIHCCKEGFTPSELAKKLRYTRMSMTRALNELEAAGLGKTIRKGKERYFYFQKNREVLWKQAIGLLQTPIKEIFWIQVGNSTFKKIKDFGFIAGLSALAWQSNLNAPSCPVFAIFQDTWKTLIKSENIKKIPISEEASMQIEIWRYDPDLFDKDNIVDPFSLYLSLKGNEDERIEKALMNLIEKIKW
jgi:hypothetical protein